MGRFTLTLDGGAKKIDVGAVTGGPVAQWEDISVGATKVGVVLETLTDGDAHVVYMPEPGETIANGDDLDFSEGGSCTASSDPSHEGSRDFTAGISGDARICTHDTVNASCVKKLGSSIVVGDYFCYMKGATCNNTVEIVQIDAQ